jgi:hypothetical protein
MNKGKKPAEKSKFRPNANAPGANAILNKDKFQ